MPLVLSLMLLGLSALIAAPSAAANEGSLAFVDDGPVAVSLEVGEARSLEVAVIQGGPTASVISLLAVATATPAGANPISLATAPAPDGLIATSDSLTPGGIWRPDVQVAGTVPGTYKGSLVASDAGGAFDAVAVTITVEAAATELEAHVLRAPLPDPLTLEVTRVGPGPFGPLIAPPTLELDPILATGATVGPLLDGAGSTMAAELTATGEFSVADAPASGTFKGAIGRPGGDGIEQLVAVNVDVRDFVIWSVLVILIGILLAAIGEDVIDRRVPRGQLRTRLATLRERSTAVTESMGQQIADAPTWLGKDRLPLTLVGPDATGLLWSASHDALEDFDRLPGTELRTSRWGLTGTEWTHVQELVEQQRWADESALEANAQAIDFRTKVGPAAAAGFGASAIGSALGPALHGGLVTDEADLERRHAERAELAERLGEMVNVATGLQRVTELPDASGADRLALDLLRAQLAGMPIVTQAAIAAIGTEGRQIYDAILARRSQPGPERDQVPGLDGEDEWDEIHVLLEAAIGADTGGGGDEFEDVGLSAEQVLAQVRRTGRVVLVGSIAAVLVAGIATQYLPNATFGSLTDYGGLLVWATAAGAAGQVLKVLGVRRASHALRSPTAAGAVVEDL